MALADDIGGGLIVTMPSLKELTHFTEPINLKDPFSLR
jgi:hypothetical protein